MNLPNFENLRSGHASCPSDLALDRLHAKEIDAEKAAPLEQHIAGCDDCTARMAERNAGFDALDGVDPRKMLAAIRTGVADPARDSVATRVLNSLRRTFAPLFAVAAVGAAAFVVMHRGGETPAEDNIVVPAPTRIKGLPALNVIRFVDGRSVKTVSGDKFVPGDRVRFMVNMPYAGNVNVVGIEASGALYTAWPLDATTSTRLPTGDDQLLDGAVQLDNSVGRETLYIVACPEHTPANKCVVNPGTKELVCPSECKQSPFVLEKAL